jgi:hypothetical protein
MLIVIKKKKRKKKAAEEEGSEDRAAEALPSSHLTPPSPIVSAESVNFLILLRGRGPVTAHKDLVPRVFWVEPVGGEVGGEGGGGGDVRVHAPSDRALGADCLGGKEKQFCVVGCRLAKIRKEQR